MRIFNYKVCSIYSCIDLLAISLTLDIFRERCEIDRIVLNQKHTIPKDQDL